ncbi:hypothetical protein HYPBUDRAFT_153978 [Hyphopichia burtonii NRRL Y-1933]|uniref:Alcohol dehydrogenase-like N-terminal domain-containing protein n=1 Tax=Hyphopichia burtonii NRRL Y-1933 TaxID=984485 RepID=A0A1E4RCU6_9ASCO|nr:hypothetical protein HYPBUDRAFT_153978 [Hyphopichia burtonii NRRL Y-1933]ODV65088.1 hypothetical protein HYPBUDRAFT_153978 [Hyphopichia burtonii NRRL Y-1933]
MSEPIEEGNSSITPENDTTTATSEVGSQLESIDLNKDHKVSEDSGKAQEDSDKPDQDEPDQKPDQKLDQDKPDQDKPDQKLDQDEPSEDTPIKPRKSVGFAPEPEEDLKEHHERLKEIEMEKLRSSPFHKIPPELAHLEKKTPGPKPISTKIKKKVNHDKKSSLSELRDLRFISLKDISVQNKETELNFNYPEIELPLPAHKILIDIKYVSLNSYDLAKINKYMINFSYTKVGLGYEFAGEIAIVGNNYKNLPEFEVGQKVVGILTPYDRKGALTTSLLVNPKTDIIYPIDDETYTSLELIDPKLSFKSTGENGDFEVGSSSDSDDDSLPPQVEQFQPEPEPTNPKDKLRKKARGFQIEDELPPLAKICTFPVLYTRAKQALSYVDSIIHRTGKANILVNGGDTNLGFTITQLLFSSVYQDILKDLNLILIIKEENYKMMKTFTDNIMKTHYSPNHSRKINIITFDLISDDLVLPGEKVPINYKKLDFFASEVLEAMFSTVPQGEVVTKYGVDDFKLDTIIDIIGSRKFFQKTNVRFKKLDQIQLPFRSKIYQDITITSLFNGTVSEPFLVKILKPKSKGSTMVSMCKFTVKEPSYEIEQLLDYSGEGIFNPWSLKWSGNLANSLVGKYNYYEEIELNLNKQWLKEGLGLLLANEMKFRIDEYLDWRNNFKLYVKQLKKNDCKFVFKIEDF